MQLTTLTPKNHRILQYILFGMIFALLNFLYFNEGSSLMFINLNITNSFLNNYLVTFIIDIFAWPFITYVNLSFDYNTFLFIIINGIVIYLATINPQWKIKIDYCEN